MSSRTHSTAAAELHAPPAVNVFLKVLPLTLSVFVAFITMGMQMPVLPLHLHGTLGMGPVVIGLIMGVAFAAALLSRAWAGNFADTRGAKPAMVLGFMVIASSGLAYLASLAFVSVPNVSAWVLVIGRLLLALGESLVVTGVLSLGVKLVGPHNAGKAMTWIGIAIYGAYSLGAPAGIALHTQWGFLGVAVATVLTPLLALAISISVPGVAPSSAVRTPFYKVLKTVWLPGLGLALSSVGFGMITAFIALLFAARHWGNASLVFTAFGVAFIGARLFFGHLPDKLGGARVALVCVIIEPLGLLLIWGAGSALMAYLGAALAGFGYSLAFPGFGVEAVRRSPPQSRGAAMGAYVAFLDISLGITTPLAGALAAYSGIGSVYLASAVVVAMSILVAVRLLTSKVAHHG